MDTSASASGTTVLSVHDCWRHLESASVGRVALVSGGDPEIFPVNYVPNYGTVIFRTGPGTKLDALLGGKTIALEADGLNTYGTIAWSVVVKGTAEIVSRTEEVREAAETDLSPWEAGSKNQLVRITPTELSGRRFVINPPSLWWPPLDPSSVGQGTVGGST